MMGLFQHTTYVPNLSGPRAQRDIDAYRLAEVSLMRCDVPKQDIRDLLWSSSRVVAEQPPVSS